jgi:hypothetical protein
MTLGAEAASVYTYCILVLLRFDIIITSSLVIPITFDCGGSHPSLLVHSVLFQQNNGIFIVAGVPIAS